MAILRPFQRDIVTATLAALTELAVANTGVQPNVLAVSSTGSGKTVMMADMMTRLDAPQAAIAHRQELVSQISISLAREGVRHGIIGADKLVDATRQAHLKEVGTNYVDQRAHVRVCGVDTLVRMNPDDPWIKSVKRVHNDEAHHVLLTNKWGKTRNFFVNADGIGYTATPVRADGTGLGRLWDGLYDRMIEGPTMRALIDMGYLTDYDLACPAVADLDLSNVGVGASGEMIYDQVRKAVHKSKQIVGDVVNTYLQLARGKLGVTFAVDIEAAEELAKEYRRQGVPAEIVTSKTPDHLRRHILSEFKARRVLQLVNVDLFGEGFDLPAIEVVSMARPTASFALYAQQFGRALRLMIPEFLARTWGDYTDAQRLAFIAQSEKPVALVIDHVGNWTRHKLPDHIGRIFSLERKSKRATSADDSIPTRACTNPVPVPALGRLCLKLYERNLVACPHCGYVPVPAGRGTPAEVDGDVALLDPEVLRSLRGQAEAIDGPAKLPRGGTYAMQQGANNRHIERQQAVKALRDAMMLWGAGRSYRTKGGLSDREQQKLFYLTFNIDVLTAQTLTRADADTLRARVLERIAIDNVVNNELS